MTFSTLGIDATTGEKIEINQTVRRQAMYLIGSPGTGKSGLLENLILQDINQGLGLCVIDPHGTLIANIIGRCEKRLEDMIYLDVTNTSEVFGINAYECLNTSDKKEVQYRTSAVDHIFERLFDMSRSTPRMAQFVRNSSHVMIMNHLTMNEIPRLLMDEAYRRKLLANVTDQQVKLFFTNYDRLRPAERDDRNESTLNKYDELLQPLVRNIVGQVKSTITMREIMDKRKILLLKLDPRADSVSTLMGAMFLSEILAAAYARGETGKSKFPQFNLYMDEFPKYATQDFSLIIAELRKFGVATTYAHQSLEQPGMSDTIRSTALQASTKVVSRVSGADAQELVNEFEIPLPPPIVTGTRPILTPPQDTIGHLIKYGHRNPMHAYFVSECLRPTKSAAKVYERGGEQIRVTTWRESGGEFGVGLGIAMIGGAFGKNWGTDEVYVPYVNSPLNSLQKLFHEVQHTQNPSLIIPADIIAGFCNCEGGYYRLVHEVLEWKDVEKFGIPLPAFTEASKSVLWKIQSNKKMMVEYDHLLRFIGAIRQIMHVLAVEPIQVNSGQVEPVYGTPRTYADVANEYVQKIANLPNFTAMVKLSGGNNTFTTIKTIAPEQFDKREIRKRIEQIKEQNLKDGYLRKAEDVEAEIAARWDDEPPTVRKHTVE